MRESEQGAPLYPSSYSDAAPDILRLNAEAIADSRRTAMSFLDDRTYKPDDHDNMSALGLTGYGSSDEEDESPIGKV